MGLLGIAAILVCAYALSENRREVRWKLVAWGLGLQATLAVLVLKTPFGKAFQVIGQGFNQTIAYAEEGSRFVFGDLGWSQGAAGVTIAFQVLPLIIFIASLFSVLYALGLMQLVVRMLAKLMQRTLGVSGAEALNVAANIFMGMNEAPLTIRPYLDKLTRSELMMIMTGGMATISGALMVAYVQIAGVPVEHLLTAVIMTAPGCIVLGKILVPETVKPETWGEVPPTAAEDSPDGGIGGKLIFAASRGASEGLFLCLQVGAMLVAFVGLIALFNGILGGVKGALGFVWLPGSLQQILGLVFSPVAWLLGVSWTDAGAVGNLLGTRLVLNEFIAYVELSQLGSAIEPRSFLIAGYALCGFANLGSIGVQIGGIGSLIPDRRKEMAELGLRAMAAATMANFMTAAIAGLLT